MTPTDDLKYWVALSHFHPFGAKRLGLLSTRFPTMKRAFAASALELTEAGISADIASRFLQQRIHIDPDKIMRELELQNIYVVTITDNRYPPLLKEINDAPALLYIRGHLPDPQRRHVAVVGARKANTYGLRAAEDIVTGLARANVVIVSGLAYGIDAKAHDITLAHEGTTLAVLGSGIDDKSIYPASHRNLASRILSQGGALISELPPGTPPLAQHFPPRNRIIAGLCHGTLVIQSTLKSGTQITSSLAIEYNRDVYAVPGSLYDKLSDGPHQLIKMGAKPVTSAGDVIGIEPAKPAEKPYKPTTDEERAILKIMSAIPTHIDDLIRTMEKPAHEVSALLTLLEMRNAITHQGSGWYVAR